MVCCVHALWTSWMSDYLEQIQVVIQTEHEPGQGQVVQSQIKLILDLWKFEIIIVFYLPLKEDFSRG